MKRSLILVSAALLLWPVLALAQGTEIFPAYVHSKSSAPSPLTTQCLPIVNTTGTTTNEFCGGYAAAVAPTSPRWAP